MFERLRELRKEKGMTCEDMARLLGLDTKAAYSKKELGRTKFSLDDAKKVSRALGRSIDDIFFTNEVSLKDTKRNTA
jgi:transcriptional regulator with XRE-family HTH domain